MMLSRAIRLTAKYKVPDSPKATTTMSPHPIGYSTLRYAASSDCAQRVRHRSVWRTERRCGASKCSRGEIV
jgi:hypothetical protein